MNVEFILNGKAKSFDASPGESLKTLLRRQGMVSVRDGCDDEGSCGLCAVLLDGKTVNSCLILAAQVQGREVVTVEHYRQDPLIRTIQRALVDTACVQCGYCTPAVALAIRDLLGRSPDPKDEEITDALSGIICRCTGYLQFKDAVRLAAIRAKDPDYVLPPDIEFKPELRHIGKDREKVDADMLARGERAFVEDRVGEDACWIELLGSPVAHAWIAEIDTAAAEAMPGVVAILTHKNCPSLPYTTAGQGFPEPSPYDQRMFTKKVRHVGDRVAAVMAETKEEARAAAAAILVRYEVLKPVLSIAEAKSPSAPAIHSGQISYMVGSPPPGTSVEGDGRDDPIIYQFPLHADPHRNLAASAHAGIGDMEWGFADADLLIERSYKANRVQSTPMEPHTVYAYMDGGRLVLRASTQVPWHVRRIVSRAIGIPEHKVRVIKERVGGGFGAKQDIVVEDIAGYLAWTTRRPVYFRYTREQEFTASRTRHAMEITVRLGAKKDGRLTAILMKLNADTGPYGQHCLTVPMNAISKSLPLLLCDNARFEVNSYYTNLSPAGAYQGYGAPKGSFALQTAMAELAEALGMDQLDILEKNRVRSGSRIEILKSLGEGREGSAVTLGTCSLGDMIARGKEAFGWDGPKPIPSDSDWKIGRGAVIIQQGSGLPGLDAANAEIRLLPDGTVLVLSGGADLGTGLDTVAAKAAAETLGLEMEDVSVVSGDTDATPFDKGAYASSGTYFSGKAALLAAEDLKSKILTVSSKILGEPEEELRLVPRGVVEGKKGRISFAKLGHMAVQGEGHGDLVGFGSFKTDHAAFPYGAHFVQAAVNPRTGEVKVQRYHAYQDCGTPINPALAKGQVYGAILKSIGHSLYEEMLFDENGRCLNPRFLDYKVPTMAELPEDLHVELMPVEDEVGPYGAKSISEISVNGAAPAIAIAIHDAVGAWVREWPFTPERVLKALGKL
ncbi:MAG: putative selenate reductase molybdopterin-binding subunit [Spirochaetes bacterium]|nr:MAG: putative selenate reductase molybdopterin-binding subunit [Spirochaetota bacterium]